MMFNELNEDNVKIRLKNKIIIIIRKTMTDLIFLPR